jgi:2,3-bisphosphoglycerate-dependent phosphoglycerate mutase
MMVVNSSLRMPWCFLALVLVMFALTTKAFQASHRVMHRTQRLMSMSGKSHHLVLVRHGESTWNDLNKFTGWYDCPLSPKGEQEAISAGKLLKQENFHFDLAYTSYLKRAIKTLWHTLEQTDHMYIPIKNVWQLNERHYGALQGLDKKQTVEKFGADQVKIWRRSYDIPPPECEAGSPMLPVNDPKYAALPETHHIKTESLKTTLDRVLPLWHGSIAPDIKAGKRVVIAAHGNSLRALVKYLDNISDRDITELNIPTGVPLHYELDDDLKPVPHKDAIAPLSGRYIGNQEDIKKRIFNVVAQTK